MAIKTYKHYSFDLWMTLIRSDPAFKAGRTRFFYDNFNKKNKTLEDVAVIFRQIDVMCNAINEKVGSNIHAEEMYLMVISTMNDHVYNLQDIDVVKLYAEMESLVLKHLPIAYDQYTIETLRRLKISGDHTFSLLSNTAFIKGSTLRLVLQQLGLGDYFDFQLYSDEAGMSKPNVDFFNLMVKETNAFRKEQIDLTDIIHIGDNPRADIAGAEQAGISSLLINTNEFTILNLLN